MSSPQLGAVYRLAEGAIAEVIATGPHWVVIEAEGLQRAIAAEAWRASEPRVIDSRHPPANRRTRPRAGSAFRSRTRGSLIVLAAGVDVAFVEWTLGNLTQQQIVTRAELAAILRRRGRDRFVRLQLVPRGKSRRIPCDRSAGAIER